jgi:octopine/nopaline transport system ATP-binding protein
MSDLYVPNRKSFLRAAQATNAEITSYELAGLRGPHGEELAIDVACIGDREAPNVIVLGSGLHGVELPIGSSIQRQWLYAAQTVCRSHKNLRFVFLHALNPYGAAHGLRNDQNNFDLNRNFVDFSLSHITSKEYRALADAFAPGGIGKLTLMRAWGKILTYGLVTHSIDELKRALLSGQYDFPKGLYYGGDRPSWTHERLIEIIHNHIAHDGLAKLWPIDVHTGEGPYGKLQLMVNTTENSPLHERVRELATDEHVRIMNTSYAKLSGDIGSFWSSLDLGKKIIVTPLSFEFGTSKSPFGIEGLDVLHAMITRNALKECYDDQHPSAPKIIRNMRHAFNPPDPKWQDRSIEQAQGFLKQLISVAAP